MEGVNLISQSLSKLAWKPLKKYFLISYVGIYAGWCQRCVQRLLINCGQCEVIVGGRWAEKIAITTDMTTNLKHLSYGAG